jgi:hypothetical protein
MGTRKNQSRKSALANKLLPYLQAVEDAAGQRETRERRLRKRLYRTRGGVKSQADGEPRQVSGTEMLYALSRYAKGCGLANIVKDFKERGIGGVSEVAIFRAGQRFECWFGEGRQAEELDELIELLAKPDPYRGSITRNLVPTLERVAGTRSGLPPELRWQRWTLPEIWLFVRSGWLPPRVLCIVRNVAGAGTNWVSLTAKLVAGSAEMRDVVTWQKRQRTWQRRHVSAALPALAPNATREAVRKAILTGSRPHRWVEDAGLFKKAPGGRWVSTELVDNGSSRDASTTTLGEETSPGNVE